MPARKTTISLLILGMALILTLSFISSGAIMEDTRESENMTQKNSQTNEQHTEIQTTSNSNGGVTVNQESTSTQHTSINSDSSNQEQTNEHTVESEMSVSDGEDTTEIHIVGNVESGETVTITATQNGSPMTNVTVLVNDEPVEITDEEGEAQITVPADGEFVLEFTGEHSSAEFHIS